jgi:hypothetical protein
MGRERRGREMKEWSWEAVPGEKREAILAHV